MTSGPSYIKDTCLVEARLNDEPCLRTQPNTNHSGIVGDKRTDPADISSCSGVVIDGHHGLVLTHYTLVLPLLGRLGLATDVSVQSLRKSLDQITCTVVLERKQREQKANTFDNILSGKVLRPYCTAMMNISTSTPRSSALNLETGHRTMWPCKAVIKHVFTVNKFAHTLSKLMPHKEGWRFAENNTERDIPESSSENVPDLLSRFLLLELLDWQPSSLRHPAVYASRKLRAGDTIYVVSTPFGMLSPPVFLNSVSKGVVCNVAGPDQCLVLTDARCIPGGEGGGVYVGPELGRVELVGLIVASLCWKANEWMGLSIACSITEILEALLQSTSRDTLAVPAIDNKTILRKTWVSSTVCLVECAGGWGSGVIIHPSTGLILTCSHVVNFAAHSRVYVHGLGERALDARVLFCSPEGQIYDLALLKVEPNPECKAAKGLHVSYPVEGDDVQVIGYGGGFREGHCMQPSVSGGLVSKVLKIHKEPCLIQSTCGVHRGTSGGALMNKAGAIIGLVVCNTRDTVTGASYPDINLSVPMWTIWPILQKYIRTQDVAVLSGLKTDDADIMKAWKLQLSDSVAAVSSKL